MLRPTPELIDKYIRPLNTGLIGTLSYSDPETGSHFWYPVSSRRRAARTAATRSTRRRRGRPPAGFADFYVVQTTSPDFKGYDDLSVFVIDGDLRGAAVALGRARPPRQPVRRDRRSPNVEIPDTQLVGPEGDGATSNDESVDPWFLIGSSSVWNGIALGAIDIAKRHTTRKRHVDVGMRVADYPTIQDYVGEAVMETNACRLFVLSVAQAIDGATDNNTMVLEPGELARGNFLHWAWQIKFDAAQNVAHARRQDAARVRRLRLQARHGARALPARREGRLGDGPDERGAAPVRRQGRAARVRVARLLEPELQPPRRRERGQEARLDREARAGRAAPRRGRRGGGEGAREGARLARGDRLTSAPARPGARAARSGTRDVPGAAGRRRPTVSLGPTTGSRSATCTAASGPRWPGSPGPDALVELFGPSSPRGRRGDVPSVDRAVVVRRRRARRRCRSSTAACPRPTSSSRSRARRRRGATARPSLPDPLAEPRLDFQVDRASALAYEVKAGEYIQVIDVRGRQCSDFLAFSAREAAGAAGSAASTRRRRAR